MHIEPGVVDGAKMILAVGTAAAAAGWTVKLSAEELRTRALPSLAARALIGAVGAFVFFEVLPHFPVGVSEVHFILATTLFLVLGPAAAALGLAGGLAVQGLIFAPSDLPMYAVNLTTLLVPLFALDALARRVLPRGVAYADLRYADVLKLSAAYQGGVVAWVAFWVFYGQGVGAETSAAVLTFGAAYLAVIAIEPLVDLAVLAAAKSMRGREGSPWLNARLLRGT